MQFKQTYCRVDAGNLIVIDKEALTQYRPQVSTIVLIYRPPLRLADFFGQCSISFQSPYSQAVPVLLSLHQWIENLLKNHMQASAWSDECSHEQRRELARVLLAYPRYALGELFAPFYACALGQCEKCREPVADQTV